jgi:hypothetical protein
VSAPPAAAAAHVPGRVPLPVVAAAVTVVPVGLLALQAAALLALPLPALPVATVQVAATIVAGGGAAIGVRRSSPRRAGLLRSTARRLAVLAGLALVAGLVVATAAGPEAAVVGPTTAGVLAVLAAAHAAGWGVGDAYGRQVRTAVTAEQRRDADRSLPFRLLVATGLSLVLAVVAELAGAPPTGSAVSGWLPLAVLATGVAGIAAARHAVLRARVDHTVGSLGPAWRRGAGFLGLLVVLVLAVGVAALLVGGDGWLARSVPDPARWPGPDQVVVPEPQAPERQWRVPSAPEAWQVALVVAAVVAGLVLTRRAPRRRRSTPMPWRRMPLRELVRSLLAALRPEPDEHVGEEVPVEAPAPTARDELALPAPLRRLVARLRPRPRAPAAAILHDYRAVQRRLDGHDRRRGAETPLRHADRLGDDALRELAALVCDVRYAGRAMTAADADRSRELAHRVLDR